MKLIFTGDVVGSTGRRALKMAVDQWRRMYDPTLFIVNGENAAGGRGITPAVAHQILDYGVDVITLGDHAWDQKEYIEHANEETRVLRPHNMQPGTPGHGSIQLTTPMGQVGVICLMGRSMMRQGALNPFTAGYDEVVRMRELGVRTILVDFHAESTGEKVALGRRMDGLVSALLGTHTHVQTADACILPGGTAYMTDVGMCGSRNGIIGREEQAVLEGMVSGLPCKLPIAGWPAKVSGVLVETENETGRATMIQPLNLELQRE